MSVAALQKFVSNKQNLIVLTGAGISTESGIPDYRSPGRPPYKPMENKAFLESPQARKRYWSRSMVGYPRMMFSQPNLGHKALARAEHKGVVKHLLTQNVDGLHHLAGSQQVLELHGSIRKVACIYCKKQIPRQEMQTLLSSLNPEFEEMAARHVLSQLPDGDMGVEQADLSTFMVPDCPECGGVLKPAIVFFGDNLPREVSQLSTDLAKECDGLLVVGSSLAVQSAFRLIKIALRHAPFATGRGPADVFIVNDGPTRADPFLTDSPHLVQKVDVRAGEILDAVFGQPNISQHSGEAHKNEISSYWLP